VGIKRATATGPGVGAAHATTTETAKPIHVLYIFNPLGDEVDAFGRKEGQCNVFLHLSHHGMACCILGPPMAFFKYNAIANVIATGLGNICSVGLTKALSRCLCSGFTARTCSHPRCPS
jgi:hypothetical protein